MVAMRTAAAFLLLIQLAWAVNVVYDEALWTKQDWQRYKVALDPMEDFNPADDLIKDPQLLEGLTSSRFNSLDGPTARRQVTKAPTCVAACLPLALTTTPPES